MTTLLHVRFDEDRPELAPSDAMGSLADMALTADPVPLVDGFTGYARHFGIGRAFTSTDIVAGSTLATRDVTVQAIVQWDFDAQVSAAQPGGIIVRGIGGSAAERTAYHVELRVVNAAARAAEVRFVWQSIAGTTFTQSGGQFIAPSLGSWLMITATRHWISPTEVELQYYVGSQLVGEVFSADADIGGGTTGTTRIGVGLGTTSFAGAIDEVRVLDYHVTAEEVEATWLRLSKWQPGGYSTVRQLFQPGAPISNDPASRVQRLFRGVGALVGYANAQVDNFRRNAMPDRAYGSVLERWENITGEKPVATDTTKQRRSRVGTHFAMRQGVSPPGVRTALAKQLLVQPSQLEILAFANDWTEDFADAAKIAARWTAQGAGQSMSGGTWRINLGSADYSFTGDMLGGNWRSMITSVQGNAREAASLVKIVPTTIGVNAEVGVFFGDWVSHNYLLIGIRNVAGVYTIGIEAFTNGIGNSFSALTTTTLTTQYLGMQQTLTNSQFSKPPTPSSARWNVLYGAALNAITVSPETAFGYGQFCGFYARTAIGSSAAIDVSFDDFRLRQRYGARPFYWYVYRDPALPGTPDLVAAQRTLQRLAHANTFSQVIQQKALLCDSALGGCDGAPLGGI